MPPGSLREIEAKLIVCSDDPLSVVTSIGELSSVAGYSLWPQNTVSIHDYYVDTPQRTLKSADFSLRVREIDISPWLTLKGPPTLIDHGLVERLELEMPWSGDSLARILDELAGHGVRLPPVPGKDQAAPPSEVLAGMGLEKVQYRENHRQIRKVKDGNGATDPDLAELGIDSVVYHFQQHWVRHYEVEVEAKSDNGVGVLPDVVQGLIHTFPTTLQRWDHGKLSIGRAVEALLLQGELEGLINDSDQLTPAAYPLIHHILEQGKSERLQQ